MSTVKAWLLAAFGITALGGCALTKTLTVSPASAIQPVYRQGRLVLQSQKKNGVEVEVLTRQFSDQTDALPSFFVAVRNGGEVEVEFSLENITTYSGESRVRVYTVEELEKRVRSEGEAEAAAVAANEAAQLKDAAMSRQTTSRNLKDNPVAWTMTKAQGNARNGMDQSGSSRNQQPNDLTGMLMRSTVRPRETVGGTIKLHAEDIRSGQPLRLVVAIGGEVHEFMFDVRS